MSRKLLFKVYLRFITLDERSIHNNASRKLKFQQHNTSNTSLQSQGRSLGIV